MYLNADSITIESDERGFELRVMCDNGDAVVFNIQNIDLDAFYDQVKSRIGPYLRERDEALRTAPANLTGASTDWPVTIYDSGPYDMSSTKHPRYHSTHADVWDSRDGK